MRVSSKVPAPHKQTPLLDYLAHRFTYVSTEQWIARIEAGHVYHNHALATLETHVRQGDVVACEIPDYTPPDMNVNYHIIYQDTWLLAVNKPPNLRVHAQGKYVTANLIYHLRHEHTPIYPEAHLINRLDAHTSGIVLVARDKETLRLVSEQFLRQQVHKTYWAIVQGVPTPDAGKIDLPIGQSSTSAVKVRQDVHNPLKAKEALTYYETVQTWADQYALLRLSPKTGRTHQLRVHMMALGNPIVGDALYTLSDEAFLDCFQHPERYPMLLPRQALHCGETAFQHPHTDQTCTIQAEMPADMRNLIQQLDRKFPTV